MARRKPSVRDGGVVVDDGGRPVTDAGGRLVFRTTTGKLVLDDAGTAPTEPLSGTPAGS